MFDSKTMSIESNGYILLSNVLTEDQLQYALSCMIKDNEIDYSIMKQFIDDAFFPTIKNHFRVIKDPTYVKFRFSNNNNSTDASTFHGDVYNHKNTELLPIYTCICYFDDAELEIIPGSHKYNNNGWSLESYNNKKNIIVNRGDILIFHANLHHRGINFNKEKNRRLLQVFEVFPDKETYHEYSSDLVIIQSSNNVFMKNIISPLLYELSKYPMIIDIITFVHYILMYNDAHYKIGMMDIEPWNKTDKYITYEPGRRVLMKDIIDNDEKEELNVNIICDPYIKVIPHSYFYLCFYLLYWIISAAFLYVIFSSYRKNFYIKKIKRMFSRTNRD